MIRTGWCLLLAFALSFVGSIVRAEGKVESSGANPQGLVAFRNGVLYVGQEVAGPRKGQLSVLHSTATETRSLLPVYSATGRFGVLGDTAYFTAYIGSEGTQGGVGLYKTDGMTAALLKVVRPTPDPFIGFSQEMVRLGDKLFFVAQSSPDGYQIWVTDGTPGGTVPISRPFSYEAPSKLTKLGCNLIFYAGEDRPGRGLWITDGTPGGEQRLSTATLTTVYSTAVLGDQLFLSAGTEEAGFELWVTNGTSAGSRMVKDIRPGVESSIVPTFYEPTMVTLGKEVFFFADDGVHGSELWKSDGSEAGTQMVIDLDPRVQNGTPNNGAVSPIVASSRHIYFVGNFPSLRDIGEKTRAIIRSDGTSAGTEMLDDGVLPGSAEGFTVTTSMLFSHNRLYAATRTIAYGEEVHELGVDPGTVSIFFDASPRSASSSPEQMTPVGDTLFWSSTEDVNGAFRIFAKNFTAACNCAASQACLESVCAASDESCGGNGNSGNSGGMGNGVGGGMSNGVSGGMSNGVSGVAGAGSGSGPTEAGGTEPGCGCKLAAASDRSAPVAGLTAGVLCLVFGCRRTRRRR